MASTVPNLSFDFQAPEPRRSARFVDTAPRGSSRTADTLRKVGWVNWPYILYFMLHALGFVVMTLLMMWGVFVLFFLAIGGFSVDGMMHHLANLSSRYIAADMARMNDFKLVIGGSHMVVACAIIFFRRHAILPPASPNAEKVA